MGSGAVGGTVRRLQSLPRDLSRRRASARPAAGAGDDGGGAQQRSRGRQAPGTENRLRRASDRIWSVAGAGFQGGGRLGYRCEGFQRGRRPAGVLSGRFLLSVLLMFAGGGCRCKSFPGGGYVVLFHGLWLDGRARL